MATPYLMRFHRIRYSQRSRNSPPKEVGEDVKRQIIEKQQLKIVKLEEEVHSLNTHRKVIENDMHILFNKITEKENNII